jgi:hypothetical protein
MNEIVFSPLLRAKHENGLLRLSAVSSTGLTSATLHTSLNLLDVRLTLLAAGIVTTRVEKRGLDIADVPIEENPIRLSSAQLPDFPRRG